MPDDRSSRPYRDALRCAGITVGGIVVVGVALGLLIGGRQQPEITVLDLVPREGAVTAPPAPPAKECLQCAIEDRRSEAHKQQVEITARYLGLEGRWLDGQPTKLDCTRDREIWGVVRFALVGDNPWLDWWGSRRQSSTVELALPCPDLSRPDYAGLYRYQPGDTERDGLGHAPVLQRGKAYRLKLVANPDGVADDPIRPGDGKRRLTLVAVNPL